MDVQQILADLNRDRDRLDRAITALEGLGSRSAGRRGRPAGAKQSKSGRGGSGITPAGRKKLSEMMKKRWAERKKKKAAAKRKPMSAATRKRLSEMMKKRWVERKKGKPS